MTLYNYEEKTETIVASIIGMERCDMVIHLAKLLRNAKSLKVKNTYGNVLLIDNSVTQEIYNMVSIGDSGVADYRGITVMSNVGYTPEEFMKHDYVLVYHGLAIDKELIYASDYLYCITNYEKNLNKIIGTQMEEIDTEDLRVTVIYRDKAFHKISEKNINHYAGLIEKDVKTQHILKYDPKDYALYLSLTHNGSQAIKNYSEAFINALRTMTYELLEWPNDKKTAKSFDKLIKKAR